jgi:UDP-2,3-diacylglucosamine hydrolase
MAVAEPGTLAIIAGGGTLPCDVAEAARATGRNVHIIGISGFADEPITRFPHTWVKLGQVGRLLATLESQNCSDIVIIGSVSRPEISTVRFDLGAIKILPRVLSLTVGGDDKVLSAIVRFFEEKGYKVRSASDVVPSLLAAEGTLGKASPHADDLPDIALGFEVIGGLGRFDIGQAVVVARGHVIAVEAVEGTDAMLARAGDLKQWHGRNKRVGVLIKAPKPSQEMRVDLPTIGPNTIEKVAAAGLAGIAVAAGQVLIADRQATIEAANRHGLFVVGRPYLAPAD